MRAVILHRWKGNHLDDHPLHSSRCELLGHLKTGSDYTQMWRWSFQTQLWWYKGVLVVTLMPAIDGLQSASCCERNWKWQRQTSVFNLQQNEGGGGRCVHITAQSPPWVRAADSLSEGLWSSFFKSTVGQDDGLEVEQIWFIDERTTSPVLFCVQNTSTKTWRLLLLSSGVLVLRAKGLQHAMTG